MNYFFKPKNQAPLLIEGPINEQASLEGQMLNRDSLSDTPVNRGPGLLVIGKSVQCGEFITIWIFVLCQLVL